MKNKNRICGILLTIIVSLISVAVFYSSRNFYRYQDTMGDRHESSSRPSVDVQDRVHSIENFADFSKYINSEQEAFIVFGKDNCSFCSQYKPVLEKIAKNYNVDIAYVNMTSLSEDDYYDVMNSNLVIPAKCVREGMDIALKEGFGTPLSLFVRDGSVYDCIRGYNDYETSEILIKRIGYIK